MAISVRQTWFVSVLLVLWTARLLGQDARGSDGFQTPSRQKVLILFDETSRHIDLVAAARSRIEQAGGRVRAILGLAGLVAEVPPGSLSALGESRAIAGSPRIYRETIAESPGNDAMTRASVAAWNRLLAPVSRKAGRVEPPVGAPPTDVAVAPDTVGDPDQRRALDAEYAEHRKDFLGRLPASMQRSTEVGCGNNGAGYNDTSLYLAGEIAVGIFYTNGTSGGWTPAFTAQTFADVVFALDSFIDIQPNAGLVFTYVSEIDGAGLPLPSPSNERTYDNDLRSAWCTHWAYLITVKNGGVWPNAYLHGPSLRVDRNWAPFDQVVRHETGHVFGAGDQYVGSGSYPSKRYGYLMATHANGCDSNSSGYFSGAGECLPDLMSGWDQAFGYNSIIGPTTAGQLGWYDSNGDGVLDVSETKPVPSAASIHRSINPTTWQVSYTGVAFDRPLLDEISSHGDVSINHIAAVQYSIGNAPWQDAVPVDGVFDSVSEGFQFTTPALRNGTYQVQIRAINSVGKSGTYFDTVVIAGSPVTNVRPFGSLTVSPERADIGTVVTAFGYASRDLESFTSLKLSWRWGDGTSWTQYQSNPKSKTHIYQQPGTYTVQLRVKDPQGLVHLVTRDVVIEAFDTAPTASFIATPENRHFTPSPTYLVTLNASGSYDAETSNLQVQWDADDDGAWDGAWTTSKVKTVPLTSLHYPKSDWRRVRLRVQDGIGNITEAARFIWVVPYNHTPTLAVVGVTFTPSGPNFLATVHATDADQSTTWDGLLEYRFDFDGDGNWDTRFEPNATALVTPAGQFTLAVEVKDRFGARVATSLSGCNPICF